MSALIAWLLGLDDAGAVAALRGWTLRLAHAPGPAAIALVVIASLAAIALTLLSRGVAPWRTRLALAALRAAGCALVALMLLQVEAELVVERREPPTVAVLTDASASMRLRDAAGGATRLAAADAYAAGPLAKALRRARVAAYRFAWDVAPADEAAAPAAGGGTRLVHAVEAVASREARARAIVVLSDGNDTAGDRGALLAPVLSARRLPVHAVVFGREDLAEPPRLRAEGGTPYVRLGDELRLAATLTAGGAPAQAVTVRVYEEGVDAPVATRENVRLGAEPAEIAVALKPTTAGRKTYRIVAEGVRGAGDGDAPAELLAARREVDVLDEKIHVLYVDIPRDERKILGHWLARDPIVDLATLTLLPKGGWHAQGHVLHHDVGKGLPADEADLARYDVIILGDIPRAYFREGGDVAETRLGRLADFVARRGGGLITLGGRAVYGAGRYQDSALAGILPFALDAGAEPQVKGAFLLAPTAAGLAHPIMRLEADARENRDAWLDLPKLDGANAVGAPRPGATVLAARETPDGAQPLAAVQNVGKGQVLALAVDTTWRWEMMRGADAPDHYRRFWGNAVRALAPDPRLAPKRPQIVRHSDRAALGQRLTLSTRLVDDTYRPIRDAALTVTATTPTGRITIIHPTDGRQAPGLYEYDLDLDEPGAWRIDAAYGDHVASERLVVGDDRSELEDARAKPEAMRAFTAATGGRAFIAADAAGLADALDLTPETTRRPATVPLWNLPATLVLLLAAVCVDCWTRKRRGMA